MGYFCCALSKGQTALEGEGIHISVILFPLFIFLIVLLTTFHTKKAVQRFAYISMETMC